MATTADSPSLALARPPRIQPSHVSKVIVPAFLQKLYQMVNDDKDRDLICWSEAGDSFFVLDHERFAKEVLGRWFKHQRFSSFVRQLNMYGFHKIPHLQQGVLRSDSDTEYWNFTHPNFRRDQPDLLCFIQRKKQSAAAAQDGVIDIRDPNTPTTISSSSSSSAPATTNAPAIAAPSPSPTISLTQGQLLDMHSILQGIAAIKRHQTTISSELTDLKQTNQILYSESLVARNKLQKQQELIDRILKFLAGVFGTSHSGSASSAGGAHNRRSASSDELDALMKGSDANRAVVPRRRQSSGRLMIEGAKVSEGSGKPGIVEVEDLREGSTGDAEHDSDHEEGDVTMPENNFNSTYAIETPISVPSPSPSENAAAGTGTIGETKDRPDSGTRAAINNHPTPNPPFNPSNISVPVQQPPSATSPSDSNTSSSPTHAHLELDRALTPTNNHHHNNNTSFEINQTWANLFGGRNAITNEQLTQLLNFVAQSGPAAGNVSPPNNNVNNNSGFDDALYGFDHHHGAAVPGYDVNDLGLGFGGSGGAGGFAGQGVVQPGQIQGGGESSTAGNHQLMPSPPPFSPSGFDFASFLQNLSPPPSAPLPSVPTSSFQQQQQQQQQQPYAGLAPFGLLEDSMHHPLNNDGGGLITLDSTLQNNNNNNDGAVPLSPRMERQFQSTKEVEKEVNDMDKQMNRWIEQLGPILGNAVGVDGGGLAANQGSGGVAATGGDGVATTGSIPPTAATNGLEDLDFDSFLHNMNISAAVNSSHGGGDGSGGVNVDGGEEDEEEDEDEEEEEESEGSMRRTKGGKTVVAPTTTTKKKTKVDMAVSNPSVSSTTPVNGKKRKSDVMMMSVDGDDAGGDDEGRHNGGGASSTSMMTTTRGVKAKRRKD